VGEGVYISLTGFTGWSGVLSAREMSLLASPVLAVINIVYDMFVEWTQGLEFNGFEFCVQLPEIILVR
jgi:hypothetical protein